MNEQEINKLLTEYLGRYHGSFARQIELMEKM
jgi:hypothetical protein